METRSLVLSMNPNFSSFELSRHVAPVTRLLVPFRSAKLVPRSISRVSASFSTPNSEIAPSGNTSGTDKNAAISVKPVYVPTPPNRELRTPHSGYHFDGTSRKFFEGWYFRVSIPEKKESFCFMYSVDNPAFRKRLSPLDVALYGPRFTGVGAQILALMTNTYANTHKNLTTSGEEFNRRVSQGFQVTPLWHQGHIIDDGRTNYTETVKSARWEKKEEKD